jgi:hypothetical protein
MICSECLNPYPVAKRLDEMTADELTAEERVALEKISAANRSAQEGVSRIHDVQYERFNREMRKPRRNRK